MTKIQTKLVIASDPAMAGERGNLIKIITTQSLRGEGEALHHVGCREKP